MWAAQCGHLDCVNYLCSVVEYPVNAKCPQGVTALMCACREGHAKCAKLLLQRGAVARARTNLRRTALIEAAHGGHPACVALLLDHGVTPRTKCSLGRTPLMWACVAGRRRCVKLLLRRASPFQLRDRDSGYTALHWACYSGSVSCAQLLIDHGARERIDLEEGKLPSEVAGERGHYDVVDLLTDEFSLFFGRLGLRWVAAEVAATFRVERVEDLDRLQHSQLVMQIDGLGSEDARRIVLAVQDRAAKEAADATAAAARAAQGSDDEPTRLLDSIVEGYEASGFQSSRVDRTDDESDGMLEDDEKVAEGGDGGDEAEVDTDQEGGEVGRDGEHAGIGSGGEAADEGSQRSQAGSRGSSRGSSNRDGSNRDSSSRGSSNRAGGTPSHTSRPSSRDRDAKQAGSGGALVVGDDYVPSSDDDFEEDFRDEIDVYLERPPTTDLRDEVIKELAGVRPSTSQLQQEVALELRRQLQADRGWDPSASSAPPSRGGTPVHPIAEHSAQEFGMPSGFGGSGADTGGDDGFDPPGTVPPRPPTEDLRNEVLLEMAGVRQSTAELEEEVRNELSGAWVETPDGLGNGIDPEPSAATTAAAVDAKDAGEDEGHVPVVAADADEGNEGSDGKSAVDVNGVAAEAAAHSEGKSGDHSAGSPRYEGKTGEYSAGSPRSVREGGAVVEGKSREDGPQAACQGAEARPADARAEPELSREEAATGLQRAVRSFLARKAANRKRVALMFAKSRSKK